jgi:MYXO-CTERM domain-containing protein
MSQTTGRRDPAELEAHIERTREDLATTVDALAARLDVRSRAAAEWRRVRHGGAPGPLLYAGAAAVLGVAALVLWRRR